MPILIVRLVQRVSDARQFDQIFDKSAPSLSELFQNPDEYISQIPIEDRFNVFYTVADCHKDAVLVDGVFKKRQMIKQSYLPIDIDDCDTSQLADVLEVVCHVTRTSPNEVLSVASGHGLQVLIELSEPFTHRSDFDKYRVAYNIMCDQIDAGLASRKLSGHADRSIWSNARLMRMPGTINRKADKPDVMARCLNAFSRPYAIDLNFLFGVGQAGFLPKDFTRKYPEPDTHAVLAGCEFLKWLKANQANASEPQWYAGLSVIGRLKDGSRLAHEYSQEHPGYTPEATEAKLKHAITAAGPATCDRISTLWDGCPTCPNYGKCTSPITIKGDDFILTEKSGFHFPGEIGSQGRPKAPKPDIVGLTKFFRRQYPYRYVDGHKKQIYVFNGQYWEPRSDDVIIAFSQAYFNPKPNIKTRAEFVANVCAEDCTPVSWFTDSTFKRINFLNGVLNLKTMEFGPHSQEYGFQYVLPYEYDPKATAPQFEKFLLEISNGRPDLVKVILEFMGYCVSGDECWTQKAMILLGSGRNGKSTLLDTLKKLIGHHAYSTCTLGDFKDPNARFTLFGKLCNIAEETPYESLLDASTFKNLVSGGEVVAKKLWQNKFSFKNRAKLIFAANEIPASKDAEEGFFRRFIVVPFDYYVPDEKIDHDLHNKLASELAGILNLCLDAYRRLVKNQRFTDCSAITEQLDFYRSFVDDVSVFFDEEMELTGNDEDFISCRDVFMGYQGWSKTRNQQAKSHKRFFLRLQKIIPAYKDRFCQKRPDGSNIPEKGLRGVRVNIDKYGERIQRKKLDS